MPSTSPQFQKPARQPGWLSALLSLPFHALCLVLSLFQRRLLFMPSAPSTGDPSDVDLEFEELWIETELERVHAWCVPHPAPRAWVLFLHGNSGNLSDRLSTLEILHALGLATLIIDYPGYGRSTGTPSERSCDRAARAALAELKRRAPRAQPILVWGRSLGGGVGSALLEDEAVELLILESTFSALPVLVHELYPWVPRRCLLRMEFPSAKRVRRASQRVLVIHSQADELVAFSHAQELLQAAGERGTLITIEGGHGSGFLESGALYTDPIDSYLTQHLAARDE